MPAFNAPMRVRGSPQSSGTPAWRTAMTATDTVYAIGDLPSVAAALIDWPAAGAETLLFGSSDANYVYMHYGYGGSVFVPEIGAHGAMVFGMTGEGIFSNQLTQLSLSPAAPTYTMFTNPNYAVSEAEAITMGASWYYDKAAYDALVISDPDRIIPRGASEGDFAAGWDQGFPVGYVDWIIRGKTAASYLGDSQWHSFRYDMPRYIPPAMTGTANGAIITTSRGPIHGPFGQGQIPAGVDPADWVDDYWSGTPNKKKHYLYAVDVQTKVSQRLTTPIPDFGGNEPADSPRACVDLANKRVYYLVLNSTANALLYADFTAGLAGMTMSGPTNLTDSTGGMAVDLDGNSILAVPTTGVNAGRRLWFLKDSTGEMLLIDIDANTLQRLTIASLPPDSEWWGFAFDKPGNRLIITTKGAFGMRSYRAPLPTDPTDQSEWTFTMTELTFDTGVTLESGQEVTWQGGERSEYLESLGVIFATQKYGKALAYRPGA